TGFLVNGDDLLLRQAEQLDQDGRAAWKRLGANRTVRGDDLLQLRALARLPELDVTRELGKLGLEIVLARYDVGRHSIALRRASEDDADVAAIACGELDIDDVEAERFRDEAERFVRIGPRMLVI